MRPSALATIVASTLLAASSAPVASTARAADDELPTGNDPPRIVPLLGADVYWAYHDTPPSGGDATFTTSPVRHNEFQVGLVSIGARLEHAKLMGLVILQAGTAADALYSQDSSSPIANRETWKHIQEANVGWRFSQDFSVTAGVFSSHFGNESFPTFGNWNYSHAMISDATPYYLAGVKAKWNATSTLAFTLLVYNGWQAFQDVNKYKSGGFRVDWSPLDWLSVADAVSVGPEIADTNVVRYFDDLVVKAAPHPRLGVAAEGYAGVDHDHSGARDDQKFFGAALWLRWFFSETLYLAVRGERLVDTSGLLTGCGARPLPPSAVHAGDPTAGDYCFSGAGQKLWGGTVTIGWRPHPMFLARIEGTHRRSDDGVPFFAGGTDATTGNAVAGVRDQSTTFSASVAFNY
jgi:hypothetical protein